MLLTELLEHLNILKKDFDENVTINPNKKQLYDIIYNGGGIARGFVTENELFIFSSKKFSHDMFSKFIEGKKVRVYISNNNNINDENDNGDKLSKNRITIIALPGVNNSHEPTAKEITTVLNNLILKKIAKKFQVLDESLNILGYM